MGSHCRAAVTRAAILSEQTLHRHAGHHDQCSLGLLPLNSLDRGQLPLGGQADLRGAVTKELSTLVKICVDGKLKLKKKSDIAPGWPKAGGECVWYGAVLCDGAVVQDLYRWWFLRKCSKGRMSVTSRSWSEVTSDERYRAGAI